MPNQEEAIAQAPTRTHIIHYASAASKLRRTQGLRGWNGEGHSEGHLGRTASRQRLAVQVCRTGPALGIGLLTLVRTQEASGVAMADSEGKQSVPRMFRFLGYSDTAFTQQ